MIISKSKNFAYIHIEKTGGTSIEHAIMPYLSKDDIFFGGMTSEIKTIEKRLLWKHSSASDIKKYIGSDWDKLYKFATVRDPHEIMVSFYFYIKRNISNFLPGKVTDVYYDINFPDEIRSEGSIVYTDDLRDLYFIQSQIDGSGIDGFIYRMITNNLEEVSPQTDKVDQSVELFDISKINNNWQLILNKIKINSNVKLDVINSSNRPKNVKLNNETLSLIFNHFKKDYEIIDTSITNNWGSINGISKLV